MPRSRRRKGLPSKQSSELSKHQRRTEAHNRALRESAQRQFLAAEQAREAAIHMEHLRALAEARKDAST